MEAPRRDCPKELEDDRVEPSGYQPRGIEPEALFRDDPGCARLADYRRVFRVPVANRVRIHRYFLPPVRVVRRWRHGSGMDLSNNMRFEREQLEPAGDAAEGTTTPLSVSVGVKRRRSPRRLEIEAKGQQSDAHILFMRDFLAPLLAKEFLRQQSASVSERISAVSTNISTSGTSGRRDGR